VVELTFTAKSTASPLDTETLWVLSVTHPVVDPPMETAKAVVEEFLFSVRTSPLPNAVSKAHERYETVPEARMIWLTRDSAVNGSNFMGQRPNPTLP
jgi:hypothetical protein